MDIVDVDEALKDDSFIFLEDKAHDDISNILQQWKTSNYIPPSNKINQQPHQQQQEQAYKYDSRTFTRPKRKSAQNLELQFTTTVPTQPNNQYQQNVINTQTDNPMLNLEIGGLVTNMQKSFLQDTSPPPFASMDTSVEPMNHSLITSADFTNINFLQSTNSLDFGESNTVFNLTDKTTSDGYSLSDMIRDRKALESLTLSGDGTLIKDSHIAQIDDISLALSKTASGCSTMDNSTDSVEINNRTVEFLSNNINQPYSGGVQLELNRLKILANKGLENKSNGLHRTMVLSEEMIGDITYNLVENSMYASIPSEQVLETTQNLGHLQPSTNENMSENPPLLDETICLSTGSGGDDCSSSAKTADTTFDCHTATADAGSETPEKLVDPIAKMNYYESTPHSSNVRYSKSAYTARLQIINDEKLSPIVAIADLDTTKALNETFDSVPPKINKTSNIINNYTFSEKLPSLNNVEMIDDIENPTFDKTFKHLEQQSPASIEMKNVMDLAEAEANLLASNKNEEEFDHMLDEFSKVELNAEQLKMKKSLDSIKRRFNYGPNKDKLQHREISREAKDMRDMMRVSADILGENDHYSKDYLNMTMDILPQGKEEQKPKEHLAESPDTLTEMSSGAVRSPLKDSVTASSITDSKISNGLSLSSVSTASSGGERLLSRRSRLYDDINMSTLSSNTTLAIKTPLGSSFTIHKEDEAIGDIRPNVTNETEHITEQNTLGMVQENSETNPEGLLSSQTTDNTKETASISQYRLAEKRERDRDRFKTIKIIKNRNEGGTYGNGVSGSELNVPCIDDYPMTGTAEAAVDSEQSNQRFSRRDQNASPVFNNDKNKTEVETNVLNKTTTKINPNFFTYKKPKEKQQSNVRNLPEIAPDSTINSVEPDVASSKPRSLSRPRYLSGLTKFSAVSKATSADELERSVQQQTNLNTTTSGLIKGASSANVNLNRTQVIAPSEKQSGELKSPMGIKSKSFHNLSSHHTYTSASNGVAAGAGSLALRNYGLRKPSATGISTEKLAKTNINRNSCLNTTSNLQQLVHQKPDETVFKMPKLVSGLRAPGATTQGGAAAKRAGLVRPSSGYYSFYAAPKPLAAASSEAEYEAGRHSPTDSMSSASSKGSAQSLTKPLLLKSNGSSNNSIAVKTNSTVSLQKITIGSTGIPKPSGLRPPSNVKRSGLPRPSSFIKTDK